MKRLISAAMLAVILLTACTSAQIKTTPMYSRAESSVLDATEGAAVCSIMLRNPSDKLLSFCMYGVFGGERVLALDEKGAVKKETLAPFVSKGVVCRFPDKQTVPDDIVIVGEYN